MSTYYHEGRRAEKVESLFSKIATRYDFINDLQSFGLHRRWKKIVIENTHFLPGQKVLDVCTGTGDLALAAAKKGAQVVALDFTPSMLEIGVKRAAQAGSVIDFIHGDAMALPFPDQSFDAVTMGYGLRNLVSWQQGVRELVRVLKPGGHLAILEFGKPPLRLWRWIYFSYLKIFVPVLGKVFCGDWAAYAYLLESLKRYDAQQAVDQELRQLGVQQTRIISFLGGVMTINAGRKPVSKP